MTNIGHPNWLVVGNSAVVAAQAKTSAPAAFQYTDRVEALGWTLNAAVHGTVATAAAVVTVALPLITAYAGYQAISKGQFQCEDLGETAAGLCGDLKAEAVPAGLQVVLSVAALGTSYLFARVAQAGAQMTLTQGILAAFRAGLL